MSRLTAANGTPLTELADALARVFGVTMPLSYSATKHLLRLQRDQFKEGVMRRAQFELPPAKPVVEVLDAAPVSEAGLFWDVKTFQVTASKADGPLPGQAGNDTPGSYAES